MAVRDDPNTTRSFDSHTRRNPINLWVGSTPTSGGVGVLSHQAPKFFLYFTQRTSVTTRCLCPSVFNLSEGLVTRDKVSPPNGLAFSPQECSAFQNFIEPFG